MDAPEGLLVFAAGIAAGTINTVVGSGTLITFPTLLAVGLPPVTANVTNSMGLFPGSLVGAYGYRAELRGQRRRAQVLGTAAVLGAIVGAILLLSLPAGAFKAIVPVLIVLALLLVILGPWLNRRIAAARDAPRGDGGVALWIVVLLTGVYGGYFGAAQGVLLMGFMGVLLEETLQRQNALKNVLAGLVNLVAAIVFAFTAHIDWAAAGLVAAGSIIGGVLGARVGRRLPPTALRAIIVAVGIAAIVKLLA
ncbi:MAG: sulfite exporter TauE/SafE family protein [Actinobacteria bacterium]|nr:sulfite exporter TauE/SafE family protein [Actinomycetota bacterium]